MNALRTSLLAALAAGAAASFVPRDAAACGGPFGPGYTVSQQKILVSMQSGTERYVFQPNFCGETSSFGLVLPIPAALSDNPTLAPTSLFSDLVQIAAPKIVEKTECYSDAVNRGGIDGGFAGGGPNGVNVIGVGQVGIFDWSLIQAKSVDSFTDWLDANGYPHAAASDALFSHYVSKGWYFVAFKVSASNANPTAGKTLCGELGPISLAFPSAQATLPARIAAAGTTGAVSWDIYTASSSELSPPATFAATHHFSGDVGATDVTAYPSLAGLVAAGDHLTRHEVTLQPSLLDDDITFVSSAKQSFRETREVVTYVDCPAPEPAPTNPVVQPAPASKKPGSTPATDDPPVASGKNASSSGCSIKESNRDSGSVLALGLVGALALLRRRRR